MKQIILCIGFSISIHLQAFRVSEESHLECVVGSADSLPAVLTENRADLLGSKLKKEAFLRFAEHQLPASKQEWENYRTHLRNEIINKAGVVINHNLPLNYQETGTVRMEGYSIKKI